MFVNYKISLSTLLPHCFLLFSSLFVFSQCGDGFTETKSNGIYFDPQQVTFSSPGRNEKFRNELIEIGQSGEAPLTISSIYIKGL